MIDILGVPRPENEKDFANFDIFDDPSTPYSTFNFKYSHEAFERLSKLTEFNTLSNIEAIKKAMIETIAKKRFFTYYRSITNRFCNFPVSILLFFLFLINCYTCTTVATARKSC
jgi:hypothetical protein